MRRVCLGSFLGELFLGEAIFGAADPIRVAVYCSWPPGVTNVTPGVLSLADLPFSFPLPLVAEGALPRLVVRCAAGLSVIVHWAAVVETARR